MIEKYQNFLSLLLSWQSTVYKSILKMPFMILCIKSNDIGCFTYNNVKLYIQKNILLIFHEVSYKNVKLVVVDVYICTYM